MWNKRKNGSVDPNQLLEVVYTAVDEMNLQLSRDEQLEKKPGTVLFDDGGKLSSLHLINLIVFTEQAVEEAFGVEISLVDETELAGDENPFATIESLAAFVKACMRT